MNRDIAAIVLTNLSERAEGSDSPVVLTSLERQALQVLFGTGTNIASSDGQKGKREEPGNTPVEISPEPVIRWKPSHPPEPDVILCLDFGTSFSKAFACRNLPHESVPELIDIGFGGNDDGTTQYVLPSELFIHDGSIFFGMAARQQFEIVGAEQDRLIDNPKQYMTLGMEVAALHQQPLRSEQDPSGSLSQRDALVLYLAHLNRLAEKSLEESGFTGEIRRRYAHPAWDDMSAEANSKAMDRIMAESIMLAKCFPAEFEDRTALETARSLARKVQTADEEDLPLELLVGPVHEATAAGAGALMATRERSRQPYVILDIGAGTTDVAGCLCVNNPAWDYVKVAEVTGARKAIRRAGNTLDNILLNEILERSSLARETTEHRQVSRSLRRSIRNFKETLFEEGSLVAPLKSDEVVEIALSEFVGIESVKKLFREIEMIVTDAAFVVAGDDGQVYLVATGGGARLPIVEDLVSRPIEKDGRRMKLASREAMPDDLRETYPRLRNIYPQLAVAIGGSHPEIPEQIISVSEGIRDPGPKTLAPVYR